MRIVLAITIVATFVPAAWWNYPTLADPKQAPAVSIDPPPHDDDGDRVTRTTIRRLLGLIAPAIVPEYKERIMPLYLTTMELGRTASETLAKVGRDDRRISAERIDLTVVILFVAGGLLLTAAFFTAGFGADIAQVLTASG